MFFPTLQEDVVQQSIDVIYGKTVEVDEKNRKRVCAFLKMLQVDFEIVTATAYEVTEEMTGLNRTFDKPDIFATPSSSKDPEIVLANPSPSEQVSEKMVPETEEDDPEMLNMDDWTVTTANTDRVSRIDHSWQRLKNKKRIKYTCQHCAEICYSIKKAENHFIKMHLDIGNIVEIMADIDKKRKKYHQEFTQLVQVYKSDGNTFLLRHEMEVISDNLKELKSVLKKNTSKKLLPQHDERKNTLEMNLISLESDVAGFLKNSSK